MPSPFPGMDPYLEAHWRDVHSRLVIYASDAIQAVLPASLRARVEERVVLESDEEDDEIHFSPDVRMVEYPFSPKQRRESAKEKVAVAEPLFVSAEQPTQRYLQIIDAASGNRVITVVEFLSPSNKRFGRDRERYEHKQQELRDSGTNLVEIDLVRAGQHVMMFQRTELQPKHRTTYMAYVFRAARRNRFEVYPLDIRQRLSVIAIPLRPKDDDVPLDLQALIDLCYHNGGYDGTLDYRDDPTPPLIRREAEWIDELLREKGLRGAKKSKRRKK